MVQSWERRREKRREKEREKERRPEKTAPEKTVRSQVWGDRTQGSHMGSTKAPVSTCTW
jgi:hypothetical protein